MARRTLTREQKDDWRRRARHVLILVGALLVGGLVAGLANTGGPQRIYWDMWRGFLTYALWPR